MATKKENVKVEEPIEEVEEEIEMEVKEGFLTKAKNFGKKHGKSVQRNRIKRLLREAFRAVNEEMQGNYAVVLIPKVSENYALDTFKKHLQWMIKK